VPADFVAVDLMQHNIQNNHLRLAGQGQFQTAFSVSGRDDAVTVEFKVVLETSQEGGVVFDDENGLHGFLSCFGVVR